MSVHRLRSVDRFTVSMDPTSRGDMEAELLRRWYEAHRETMWGRYKRCRGCADNFMVEFMKESRRIGSLPNGLLYHEHGSLERSLIELERAIRKRALQRAKEIEEQSTRINKEKANV